MPLYRTKVIGVNRVVARFTKINSVFTSGTQLEDIVAAAMVPAIEEAKRLCPYRTGNLQRSIHIGGHTSLTGGLVGTTGTDIRGNRSVGSSVSVQAGTNVRYAKYMEYGTSFTYPRSFMRPAFDEAGSAIQERIAVAVAMLAKKAYGK